MIGLLEKDKKKIKLEIRITKIRESKRKETRERFVR